MRAPPDSEDDGAGTQLSISVVLATTHAWPEVAPALAALAPQVERLGGEIVVGDGHGAGVDLSIAPAGVRVVTCVGESVFALRALAMTQARGEIVAITEDHCEPGDAWAECLYDALALRHPEADAVAGPTRNGAQVSAIDRANFLLAFAETMPPLDVPPPTRLPPPTNFAVRRSVAREACGRPGALELEILPRLWAQRRVVLHRDALVTHTQSHGVRHTFAMHFHNGRASAGLVPGLTRGRSVRAWLGHPLRISAPVLRAVRGKRRLRKDLSALPLVMALACSHTAGELAGALRGPGASAAALD